MGLINDTINLAPGQSYYITPDDVGKMITVALSPATTVAPPARHRTNSEAIASHRAQKEKLFMETLSVFPDGLGINDLADAAGKTPGGDNSRMMRDLEDRGLVADLNRSQTHNMKRRRALWALTPAGAAAINHTDSDK